LAARVGAAPAEAPAGAGPVFAPAPRRGAKEPPSAIEQVLKSPLTRTVAGQITRGLLGALLGAPPRRRRRSLF
jgi:hypothetical protein